jgi:hypothetical protein
MKKNEVRDFLDTAFRNTELQVLRNIIDRNVVWLKEIERYGICVFAMGYRNEMDIKTSPSRRLFCSDIEFALAALSIKETSVSMSKVNITNISSEISYENVSKVYIAKGQLMDECRLKFIFRIGKKHYGFEGEITDEKLAEYDCVETTFLTSTQQ